MHLQDVSALSPCWLLIQGGLALPLLQAALHKQQQTPKRICAVNLDLVPIQHLLHASPSQPDLLQSTLNTDADHCMHCSLLQISGQAWLCWPLPVAL